MTLADEKRPVRLATIAVALVCATLWAGQSVAVKLAVEELPPYRVMALRFFFACLVTGSWAAVRSASLRLSTRQVPMVMVNALFLYTQIGLYTVGTHSTTSVHSIVIISAFPFFAAVACHYFLPGFPFDLRTLFGLAIAFSGVVVVFSDRLELKDLPEALHGTEALHGNLLILAAAAVMGAKIAYVKSLLGRIRPLQVVFWEALMALPLFLLTSFWFEGRLPWEFPAQAMLAVAYQGCVVSGVAFLLWTTLLARHAPNDVTVFRLATPILGVLLGWLILAEPITPYLTTGGLLLVTGIYWVTR